MKLSGNNLLLSCDILGAHKLRTLLSVTGVVVGVGAMVLMVSVGRGAEKKILDMIRSMGVNMIVVNSGQTRIFAGRMLQVETVTTLVPADAAAIVRQCPSVAGATPVVSKRVSARWGAENTNTTVVGMSP
ncbi:MAG: ABC transporter permease, partial [Gemmatimonadota bacterium]|nr:ABC transporter permease [Gemmatimonadota bacterium]